MSTYRTEASRAGSARVFLDYSDPQAYVEAACQHLLARAAENGMVVTIEQVPLQPLAMGNYETVVHVRPARPRA